MENEDLRVADEGSVRANGPCGGSVGRACRNGIGKYLDLELPKQ